MKRRLIHVGIALILAPATLQAQSDLRGSATVGRAAEFPPNGLYAASNAFPLNSLIDVTDPATGRSVRVLVVSELADSGVFVLLSPNAAEHLGLLAGATSSVRAREVVLPGLTAVDPNLDLPFHADPDINPIASLGDPNRAIIAPESRVPASGSTIPQSPVAEPEQLTPIPLQLPSTLNDAEPRENAAVPPFEESTVTPPAVGPPTETDKHQPALPEPVVKASVAEALDPSFSAPRAPGGASFIVPLREPSAPEPITGRVPADSALSEPVEREVLPDPLAERLAAAQALREAQNVALTPLAGERPDTLPSAGVRARSDLGLDLPPFGNDLQPLEFNERLASPGDRPRIAVDLPTPGDHTLPDISYPRPTPPEVPLRVALPVVDPTGDLIEVSDTLRDAAGTADERDPVAPFSSADIDLAIIQEQVPIESGELVPTGRDERIVTLEPTEFRTPPVPSGERDDLAPNRAELRVTGDPLVAIITSKLPEPDPTSIDAPQSPFPPGPVPSAAPPVVLRDPTAPEAAPEPEPRVTPAPEAAPEPEPRVTPAPEAAPEPEPRVTPAPEREPRVTLVPEAMPEPATGDPTPAAVARQDSDHIWAADNLPLVNDLKRSSVYLQVAALTDPRSAKRTVDGLGSSLPVAVLAQPRNGSDVYRVLVGPLAEDEKGSALVAVRGRGFRDAFVRNAP